MRKVGFQRTTRCYIPEARTLHFISLYKSVGAGIAQSGLRRATGWTAGIRFRRRQDISLLHSAQTGSGARAPSYPMGTVGDFPKGKAAGP
jgi:hypothetical protein